MDGNNKISNDDNSFGNNSYFDDNSLDSGSDFDDSEPEACPGLDSDDDEIYLPHRSRYLASQNDNIQPRTRSDAVLITGLTPPYEGFPFFSHLPHELQNHIISIAPRERQIIVQSSSREDLGCARCCREDPQGIKGTKKSITFANPYSPPPILHANGLLRREGLKIYSPLLKYNCAQGPPNAVFHVNLHYDILFLSDMHNASVGEVAAGPRSHDGSFPNGFFHRASPVRLLQWKVPIQEIEKSIRTLAIDFQYPDIYGALEDPVTVRSQFVLQSQMPRYVDELLFSILNYLQQDSKLNELLLVCREAGHHKKLGGMQFLPFRKALLPLGAWELDIHHFLALERALSVRWEELQQILTGSRVAGDCGMDYPLWTNGREYFVPKGKALPKFSLVVQYFDGIGQ
jgi:hypothetical protein